MIRILIDRLAETLDASRHANLHVAVLGLAPYKAARIGGVIQPTIWSLRNENGGC